jgi:double-strand break repair protein MRE11
LANVFYIAQRDENKGKEKATANDSDAASVDSMMMEIDAAGSDFEEPPSDHPPPKKKAATTSKSTAKKAPARSKGKKAVAVSVLQDVSSL